MVSRWSAIHHFIPQLGPYTRDTGLSVPSFQNEQAVAKSADAVHLLPECA